MHNWRNTKQIVLRHSFSSSHQLSSHSPDLLRIVVICNWIGEGPTQVLWKPPITCFHLSFSSVCLLFCSFVYQTRCFMSVYSLSEGGAVLHKGASWSEGGAGQRPRIICFTNTQQPPAAARGRKAALS